MRADPRDFEPKQRLVALENDRAAPSSRRGRRLPTAGLFLSALLHCAACYGLACFAAGGGLGDGGPLGLDAGFASPESIVLDTSLTDPVQELVESQTAQHPTQFALAALDTPSAPVEFPLPELRLLAEPAKGSEGKPSVPAADSEARSEPSPRQAAKPGAAGIRFFGAEVDGDAVVFLVDASSSMTDARFRRAVIELESALRQLDRGQRFAVILFNDEVLPLFHPEGPAELVEITPEIRRQASRWLKMQSPTALTNPLPALEAALALAPDSIVLLTDGELPATVLAPVRDRSRTHPRIHVLSFDETGSQRVLQTLAAATGGTYRIVK